ncbi:MAG: DUF1571 domain-containing protein [Aquabacterium sp.]|nr:MAG: DUF1571 domain-containing protein [Aquabacterium sp.]
MHPRSRLFVLAAIFLLAAWRLPVHATSVPDAASEGLAQQARGLVARIQSGELAQLPDADVAETFRRLDPEALASYLEIGVQPYNEYELWMRREERLGGRWPAKPFLNYVKYRHEPRQVYVKWLRGGAKAGQEIIYDETRRKDAMHGHVGGILNVASIWTALDGSMARSNSNHRVTDLGLQAIYAILKTERELYRSEGRRPIPDRVEVDQLEGQRMIALTWIASSPKHYAYRTKVYLDLRLPIVRGIESWDAEGSQIERIFIERIVPTRFEDSDFDPANQSYAF